MRARGVRGGDMADASTQEMPYLEIGSGESIAMHRDGVGGVAIEHRTQDGRHYHKLVLTRSEIEWLARTGMRLSRLPLDHYELERRGEDYHEDRGEERGVREAMESVPTRVEPRDTEPTVSPGEYGPFVNRRR